MYLGTILIILVLLNSFIPFSIMIPKLSVSKMHSEEFSLFALISIEPVNPKVDISNIFDQSKKLSRPALP